MGEKMTSKIILRHPLVKNCEDAQTLYFDEPYKYHVTFKDGYRMGGYDTHVKNFTSVKDFLDMKHNIEPCPKDCHCDFIKNKVREK